MLHAFFVPAHELMSSCSLPKGMELKEEYEQSTAIVRLPAARVRWYLALPCSASAQLPIHVIKVVGRLCVCALTGTCSVRTLQRIFQAAQ